MDREEGRGPAFWYSLLLLFLYSLCIVVRVKWCGYFYGIGLVVYGRGENTKYVLFMDTKNEVIKH
jgi:hypothetical protein